MLLFSLRGYVPTSCFSMLVNLLQVTSTYNGSKNIHCPNPKPPFCTHLVHQDRLVQRHYGKVSDGKPRTLLGSLILSIANVRVQHNSHEVFSADSLLSGAVRKGCICYKPVAVVCQCAGIWATAFCARQLICRQANLTAYGGGNWEKKCPTVESLEGNQRSTSSCRVVILIGCSFKPLKWSYFLYKSSKT